ncbi:Fanconi anemia group D2 protein like [Schistosoma japonicum]|nr:Fanconi anemia group D2 protein like [Schistosoma japonicum]
MLSRISNAVESCGKGSSDNYVPESCNWLQTSVEVAPFFAVPAPTLQHIMQLIGINRCQSTGQFYLAKFPFLASNSHVFNSDTPWGIAYSAQKRCRYLEMFLKSKLQLCHRLIDELHHLAVILDTNITNNLSTFISLLCPLLTDTSDSEVDIPNDDVLVLFGFPASTFQILLFTPCLCSVLTNLVLELVANRSPYSEHLLDQFRQPIGLCALFSSKQTFCDISSRLTDLFQISEEPRVQAKILGILPDLASSLCPSGCILTDEDRSLLVSQLITLLNNISLEHQRSSSKDCSAVVCLIECLTSFSVKGELMNQVHSAFFNLLNRCSGYDFFFEYLPVITRCLLINGAAVPQTSSELSNLVTRLRPFFMFAKSGSVNSAALINSTLVGLLRVAFRYNRNIISAWVHVIDFGYQTSDSACQISKDYGLQNHFAHDFIVLCIALSTLTMTDFKSGSDANVLSDRSSGEVLRSSDLDHYKRLKSEVISLVRRLLTTGRLFSFSKIHDDIDNFLANYGELLFSRHTRLFPSFLLILNQLITSSGLGPGRLKAVARCIALSLHMKAFTSCMSDHSQKQEIISHLVHYSLTGIDNLVAGCADRFKLEAIINDILITLIRLAQSSPRELGMFETNLIALRNQIDFTGLSFNSKQTNPEHFIMVNEQYLGYLHRKKHVKYIFSILAYTAFGVKNHRKHQDSLLSFIRKLLSSQSLFSKCLGIIGAVVIIEVICRKDYQLKDVECSSAVAISEDNDTAVLASRLSRVDSDRISVPTANISRSSNTSSLSLKAPDTAVADGFSDIHLLADDNGEDKHVNCSSHSSDLITPPSRLLLQLVGFVEHSVRLHCQLMVFWLDELSFCFNRITQLSGENKTNQSGLDFVSSSESHLSEQGKNLMIWMGARIMHAFQDYFILDNASIQHYLPHFPLHKSSLCEIAIALGPSWDRFSDYQTLRETLEDPSTSSPLLLPAYLNLVALLEADQHNGNLNTIDALLGCPLLMPDIFDGGDLTQLIIKNKKISTSKPYLVIGTINWFVETVNVFSPTLLLANSSLSQNFQQISSSNLFNSKRINYLSILLRLIQIAKLRYCLCDFLKMVIHTKDCLQTSKVEGVYNKEPQSQSHRVPTHNKDNVYLSNLILPTATYQPELPFSHPFVSCIKHPNQQCFNCGAIHLQSFVLSNANCLSHHKGSGSYSKLGAYSRGKISCVSGFSLIKRRKMLNSAIEIRQDNVNGDRDNHLSEVSDVAVSQNESSTIQLTGLQRISRKYGRKFPTDRLFTVTKHTSKTSLECDKLCLTTNLPELATCFRELDLSAIVLGLSSWPWIVKCSDNEIINVDSSIDWITLTWLLDELSIRLDHVIGIP